MRHLEFYAKHNKTGTLHKITDLDFIHKTVSVEPQFEIPTGIADYIDNKGNLVVHAPSVTNHAPFEDIQIWQHWFRLGKYVFKKRLK